MSHEQKRGLIIPIGGRENKIAGPKVLQRFVDECGGKDASIAIIPTASKMADTGDNYIEVFSSLGVKHAYNLKIEKRADCSNPEYLEHVANATGIFMTGGNQLLLSTILGGTPIAQLIRRRNVAGVHVAGTSAGAAFISEHMIAGGQTGLIPRSGMVVLAPGLGLVNKIIVDQHFSQRGRLGRLLTALSYNPFLTGVGIDEDTAAFLNADSVIEAVGSGIVTIIDMSKLQYSSIHQVGHNQPVSLSGITVHIMTEGQKYDLHYHKLLNDAI